ncbi:MAG: DUF6337 family protein [Fidelibacterota bacterium]
MINQLTSVMFSGVVLILTIFDTRRLNNLVSPFTVTAWPFVGISLLVNFYLVNMGFKPVTVRVQLFILLNLFIIWLIGYICYFAFRQDEIQYSGAKYNYSELFNSISRYHAFIMLISWLSVALVLYKVKSLLSAHGGFQYVGDPQFEEDMIVGPVAHVIHLAKVCFLLLTFSFKGSKHKILTVITIIGLIIAIAAVQVKYHLIWIVIMAFLYSVIQKPIRKQYGMTIFITIIVILLMNLFWILLTFAWGTFSLGNEGIREFLTKHTFNYIASSPIVLDRWLSHPNVKPEWTMIVVFKNIINVIKGNLFRFESVSLVNLSFSEAGRGISSNTGTALGVYYIIGGLVFTIFMTVLHSIVTYSVYFMNRIRQTKFNIFLNILMLMLSLLIFFVQYFTLISLYEMIIIFIVFIGIFHFFDYLREPGTKLQFQCSAVSGDSEVVQ